MFAFGLRCAMDKIFGLGSSDDVFQPIRMHKKESLIHCHSRIEILINHTVYINSREAIKPKTRHLLTAPRGSHFFTLWTFPRPACASSFRGHVQGSSLIYSIMLQRLALTPSRTCSQAYRQLGLCILGSGVSRFAAPTTTTLCEEKKGILDTLLPKDQNGSIEWGRSVSQISEAAFWDKLAAAAGQQVQSAVDSGVPTQLSYGFISGYCSGMALKKVGKAAATVLGLGFVTLQTLSYKGYITVDHIQIRKDVEDFMDLNEDGTVDSKDGAIAYKKVLEVLQYNMPAGGGFAAGFFGGLRSG